MKKQLAIIGVIGMTVSMLCFAVAAGMGASHLSDQLRWLPAIFGADQSDNSGESVHFDSQDSGTLPWNGGDSVEINLPATVSYRPGPAAKVTISGNAEDLRHVRLRGNRFELDSRRGFRSARNVHLDFTGPAISHWEINGVGSIDLVDIGQEKLDIGLSGSATVKANGTAQHVSLSLAGSCGGDLSRLQAQRVHVFIAGSGDVDIAAQQSVDVSIAGSGEVRVHGQGAQIHSSIAGSGAVKQVP